MDRCRGGKFTEEDSFSQHHLQTYSYASHVIFIMTLLEAIWNELENVCCSAFLFYCCSATDLAFERAAYDAHFYHYYCHYFPHNFDGGTFSGSRCFLTVFLPWVVTDAQSCMLNKIRHKVLNFSNVTEKPVMQLHEPINLRRHFIDVF